MKLTSLGFGAARALPVYPPIPARLIGLGSAITLLGALVGAPATGTIFLLTLAVAIPTTLWWFVREVVPAQTTKGVVTRKGDRQQRAGGVASIWDVLERAGIGAMKRQIPVLRPSMQSLPRRKRKARDVGFLIAKNGLGWRCGQQLWSGCRDATLRVGGPGTYKTLSLACHGIDAPGALLSVSTRFDLARHVHAARRLQPGTAPADGRERAVHIYNPTGRGGIPSTVRWNVLTGCADYATAQRRAADFIPENPSRDGEHWDRKARTSLAIMLHAAAIGERSMSHIVQWVAGTGVDATLQDVRREIVSILASLPGGGGEIIGTLNAQLLSVNDRTRTSITQAMTAAVAWMGDPIARDIGAAPLGTMTLDVQDFILNRETLHIIGPSQVGTFFAPLTSAFVAEVAWQARKLASFMPNERLDPFLTMLLDEIAVAVNLPLDKWTADMGGGGITIHMAVQSLSQLEQTWGSAGAGTLLGNVGSLLMFGGGKDADELERISKLCGDRWRRVVTEDTKVLARIAGVQRGEWEKVRVLTAADLMNLEPGQAAILQRNLGGVFIGRPPQIIDRKRHVQVAVNDLITDTRTTREPIDVSGLEVLPDPAEETA